MMYDHNISELIGKLCTSVTRTDEDAIVFACADGTRWELAHHQDCCESVTLEEIIGDLEDLVGSPITVAEEVSSEGTPPKPTGYGYEEDSYTWTFYKLATHEGYVTLRWYGTSNGYYSESVEFYRLEGK